MHKANKTLEKGYKYTRPTFHYTHPFKRTSKILEIKLQQKSGFPINENRFFVFMPEKRFAKFQDYVIINIKIIKVEKYDKRKNVRAW